MVTGHADPDYARTLVELGRPRELPRCRGWVLEREIFGAPHRDAIGCYPLFGCQNWRGLKDDPDALGTELVSFCMVPDPLGQYELSDLEQCFDFVRPLKEHIVVDLQRPREAVVGKHHRKMARRALRRLRVE
ncbi:MAG: hypothetical protein ACYTAS_14360 [Planctomycetota bacterium]